MTMTCPEPAAPAAPAGDSLLDAELAGAAHCATVLEEAGLRVAFEDHPDRPLAIALRRSAGEPVRRIGVGELLELIARSPEELRAWAERPERPIPGRATR